MKRTNRQILADVIFAIALGVAFGTVFGIYF